MNIKKLTLIVFSICFLITEVLACSIPVFRYAFEKWAPDPYVAVILHQEPLENEQKEAADLIKSHGFKGDGNCNIITYILSESEFKESRLSSWLEKPPIFSGTPKLMLFAPQAAQRKGVLWEADLTLDNAKRLLYSDLRFRITESIRKGTSAIFVMIESGDKAKDDAAWKLIENNRKTLKEKMEIPDGVVATDGSITGDGSVPYDPENQLQSAIPLKIDFESIRTSIKVDPVFAGTLGINQLPEEVKKEPLLYAVFGRGRTLEPMFGEDLNSDNLFFLSTYLCGECSCQVKNQNPGYDLMFTRNWDMLMHGVDEEIDFESLKLAPVVDISNNTKDTPPVDAKNSESNFKYIIAGVILLIGLMFSAKRFKS